VVQGGTASIVGRSLPGYNIAGKTGTTTDYHDLWFIGYTPEVSLGVWSGFEYNYAGNKDLSKNAWIRFFRAIVSANPRLVPAGSDFPNPGGFIEPKCFECNRAPAQPTVPGTPGTPGAPGTQPPAPGPLPAPGTQPPAPGPTPPPSGGTNPPPPQNGGGGTQPPPPSNGGTQPPPPGSGTGGDGGTGQSTE
jgi:penicillin-binding protein